jgi:two-component system sensor histidine kinase BarA
MDIQMPDLDGVETTKQIRTFDKRFSRHRAIVALTAHALEEEKQSFLEKGFNHCLTKPIDFELLISTIEHWTGFHPDQKNKVVQGDIHINKNKVIDINEGLRLAGNKADLADEMLEMLVKSLPKDLEEAEKLFKEENNETLLEKVHYIHGACRYCGAPLLRKSTMELETLLKSGDLQQAELEQRFEKLKSDAEDLIEVYQKSDKPLHG